MPQLDGRETLRQLRQRGDWTPVILLTQIGTPAERAMTLQEGADDYLNKPFNPMELVARIQAVLRRTQRGNLPLSSFRHLKSVTEHKHRNHDAQQGCDQRGSAAESVDGGARYTCHNTCHTA